MLKDLQSEFGLRIYVEKEMHGSNTGMRTVVLASQSPSGMCACVCVYARDVCVVKSKVAIMTRSQHTVALLLKCINRAHENTTTADPPLAC